MIISNFGATIVSIIYPDGTDVVLGFDTRAEYDSPKNPWMGSICGRVNNRIQNASFKMNGKTVEVTKNNGVHHMHGGNKGFSHRFWKYN